MKKIKLLLLGIICLLVIPMTVFADGGGPVINEYDVIVTNPNGEQARGLAGDPDFTIPYNTRLTIYIEYNEDGVLWGEFVATINGKEETALINLDTAQISPVKYNFDHNEKVSGYIYVVKEGAYLYNGPARGFGKVSGNVMLPVGTLIEYTYEEPLFVYVTYNGVSGWVYSSNDSAYSQDPHAVAFKYETSIYASKDVNMYESPDDTSNKVGILLKNATVKTIYRYSISDYSHGDDYDIAPRTTYYYVTYNGVSGWVKGNDGSIGIQADDMLFDYENDIQICSTMTYDIEDCKNIVTIPKNTMLISDYYFTKDDVSYYRYKYNNTYVYAGLYDYGDAYDPYIYYKATYTLTEDLPYYDGYNGNPVRTIQRAGKIDGYLFYDGWLYNPSNKLWLKLEQGQLLYEDGEEVHVYIGDDMVPEPAKEESKPTSNINNGTKISVKQVVAYCVIGAGVLIVIVSVIIIFVNKGKNKNKEVPEKENNTPKEEEKSE